MNFGATDDDELNNFTTTPHWFVPIPFTAVWIPELCF